MNKSGDLGSFSGQLTSIPKKATDQFRNEPIKTIETVEAQVGIKLPPSATSPQDNKSADASGSTDASSNKTTLEIVKKMYEASETKINVPSDKIISKVVQDNPKKTPEEIQKKVTADEQFKQHLHKTTYYDPTFNPPKKGEPRPAEQTEKEEKEKKQMEALELRKEEKKKEELLSIVKGQGTHEKIPGIAG